MTEQILILKLLADLKQPVQSFGELEARVKTLRKVLKNTPNEGTKAFDKLAQQISGELNVDIDTARKKIKEFADTATKEIQEGSQALRDYRKALRTVEAPTNSINEMRQHVRGLTREVDNLDRNTQEFADRSTELRRLNRELIDIEQTTLRGGRNVGNYHTAFRGLARTLSGVGAAFGRGFGISALTQGVRRGAEVFIDYNQQIALLRAVSGASSKEIGILDEQSKRLGETTQFTATQVATLQTNLARLGFRPDEIEKTTAAVLDFSIATGEDLAGAGKTAGQTIRAFNLDASESTRVVDVLTEAFNSSALQLETYREGYKLFAPVATQLKIPLEEVAASLGIFADNGLEGTIATTSLATAFNRLVDPAGKAAKEAERLGIQVFDNNGRFVGLAQLLKNVEDGLEGMTDKQRLAAIATIFGARATKNFSTLLNAQKEVVTENGVEVLKGGAALEAYTKQLERSGGAAKATAAIVGDTLSQDILKLRSAIEGAAIRFGELNEGGLREFIQFLTRAVPVLAENTGLILKVVAALGLYIAATKASARGTVLHTLATKGFSAATTLLGQRIGLTNGIMAAFNKTLRANPIGLAVAAVAALVIGFQELYSRSDRFREFIDGIVSGIRKFVTETGLVEKGTELIGKGIGLLSGIVGKTVTIIKGLTLGIRDFFTETETGRAIIGSLVAGIKIWFNIQNALLGLVIRAASGVKTLYQENDTFRKVITFLLTPITKLIQGIQKVAEVMSNTTAFTAGLRAEVANTLANFTNFFARIVLSAQIAAKQLEKLNPFGKTNEQIDEEIRKLKDRRKAVAEEGRAFGESFTEAYNNALRLEVLGQRNNSFNVKANVEIDTTTTNNNNTDGDIELPPRPDEDQLTYLEELQNRQRELSAEIKNLIAENMPYGEQLAEFQEKTAELTRINNEYNISIGKIKDTTKDYAEGSLKDYEAQIAKLREEQSKLNLETEAYQDTQDKIDELTRKRAEQLELLSTRTDEYRQSIIDLNDKINAGDAELGLSRTALNDIQNVTDAGEAGAEKIKAIQEKLATDLNDLQRSRLVDQQAALEDEIEQIDLAQRDALQQAGDNEQKKIDILTQFAKERGEVELDLLNTKRQILDKDLEAFKANEKEKTKAAKEEEDKRRRIVQAAFDVANELNSTIFTILENRQQQEQERAEEALDQQEERALRQAEIVGASEEQQQAIRERFNRQREELEREAARKAKRNALIQAAINTALAVTKALATLPPPASFITAALTGALGAIQLATISSQRFALGGLFADQVRSKHPKFGKGAYLSKGAYHSSGGMPIINPHTGQKVAEIEKDEGIINRRSMRSRDVLKLEGTPYEIASQLNSYKGYGVAYPKRRSSGRAKMIKARKPIKFNQGGNFGINRKVVKLSSGAVFSSDIQNEALMIGTDNEQKKLTMLLVEEVRELKKSNMKGFGSIPSTAEELKRANQLVLDEENAS